MSQPVRDRIATMLDGIARNHGVHILLAVESGSRAWGFPSSDSDWDVRFLFLRPRDDYLRIAPRPDAIEVPITDLLDLSGWDLRKAMALLVASNAVVLEWLNSPVVYRKDDETCRQLLVLAQAAAHLPALSYHYHRLARRHLVWVADAPVRFKTLFYALRAALALAWIRGNAAPPPMDLDGLMAGLDLPSALRDTIARLRVRKLASTEADMIDVPNEIDAFLAGTLAPAVPRPAAWNKSQVIADADRAFPRFVHAHTGACVINL